MKKLALALAASIASAPAIAGPYVNVETNGSYTGSDYTSRATDLHLGFENTLGSFDWYAQGGKTINAADGVDSDSNWSGKVGGSVAATEPPNLPDQLESESTPSAALIVLPPCAYQSKEPSVFS